MVPLDSVTSKMRGRAMGPNIVALAGIRADMFNFSTSSTFKTGNGKYVNILVAISSLDYLTLKSGSRTKNCVSVMLTG
jgi:hypothetical protein